MRTPHHPPDVAGAARAAWARVRSAEIVGAPLPVLLLAPLIGAVAALAVWGFVELLRLVNQVAVDDVRRAFLFAGDRPSYILLPAVGGLVTGLLIHWFARDSHGHGTPEIMLAIERRGGRIPLRVTVTKTIASALTIGFLGSAGREGPAVSIGAGTASFVGRRLRLRPTDLTALVAAGGGAGIAAIFNAPLAGAFFAGEVLLADFGFRSFAIVVLATVAAGAVTQATQGQYPAFSVPDYGVVHPGELLLFVPLGILSALAALLFVAALEAVPRVSARLVPQPVLRPMLGGLAVGMVALWSLHPLGGGYTEIGTALAGAFGGWLMFALAFAKIGTTSVTLGSGGSGGLFAPGLFIGAMTGGAFGHLASLVWGPSVALPGAYALVGMAAVLSAQEHAPITSTLLIFEITRDYRMVLPLLLASGVSVGVARVVRRDSINTAELKRFGVTPRSAMPHPLRETRVREVMSVSYPRVAGNVSAGALREVMEASDYLALPVVDEEGRLVGVATRADLERLAGESDEASAVGELTRRQGIVTAAPDEYLDDVLRRSGAAASPVIPVVYRGKLAGVLTRERILRTYEAKVRATGERAPSRRRRAVVFYEAPYGRPAPATLASLALPPGALAVLVLRRDRASVPSGDTLLLPGDRVLLVVERPRLRAALEKLGAAPSHEAAGGSRDAG